MRRAAALLLILVAAAACGGVVVDPPADDDAGADGGAARGGWWCFDQPAGFGGRLCYSDGAAACERARPQVPGAGPCYAAEP